MRATGCGFQLVPFSISILEFIVPLPLERKLIKMETLLGKLAGC